MLETTDLPSKSEDNTGRSESRYKSVKMSFYQSSKMTPPPPGPVPHYCMGENLSRGLTPPPALPKLRRSRFQHFGTLVSALGPRSDVDSNKTF